MSEKQGNFRTFLNGLLLPNYLLIPKLMLLNTKIILTIDDDLKKSILQKFSFNLDKKNGFEIFSYKRKNEEEENIIFFYSEFENLEKTINYIKENYIFDKFVLIGNSIILRNQDLEEGDIILPNTFIDKNGKNPIFLEYAIGENYDLHKFGLLLSGVCINGKTLKIPDNKKEFQADIIDKDSYIFLKKFKNEDLEKLAIIRNCIKKDSKNIDFENLLNILDVMI